MGIVIALILIIISSIIIWYSTAGFEKAADYLGRNLTKGVKGATLNAIASSMPEFLATVFFLFYLKDVNAFSGGIGITAGSAVFNILIIPLAILVRAFFSYRVFKIPLERKVIIRDGVYLIITNVLLILILRNKSLQWFHGIFLIMIYIAYTFYMFYDTRKIALAKKKATEESNEKERQKPQRKHYSLEYIILKNNALQTKNALLLLTTSVLIMTLGTWILVLGTEYLGRDTYELFGYKLKGLNIPLIYVSILLAAAASSIPDTMLSIRDTKKGNFADAISNAFGSNTFDISFALGLPLLAYTIIYQPISMDDEVRAWSMSMWLVMLAINIIVFLIMVIGKKIGKLKGAMLLILYVLFVFFVIEEAVGNSVIAGLAKSLLK